MRGGDARLAPTLAMLVAIFVGAMDISIMATVMPTIVGQLGGLPLYSWSFSAYLLTSTTTVPIYGRLADLYGRKRIFLVGMSIFALGSLLCGLARSMEQLIAFRALQGLGAGGLLPIAITVAGDLYQGEERAKIQGYISAVWGLAAILGPLIGSVIVAQVSWSWVFWINLPIGATTATILALTLRERLQPRTVQVDYLGAVLLTGGIAALLFGLVDSGPAGLLAPHVLGLFGAAGGLLAAFVAVEQRVAQPIVPLALLRERLLAVTSLGALVLGGCIYSSTAYLPLFVQGAQGGSQFQVALVSASVSVAWTTGSIIGGRLLLRVGVRTAALAGLALVSGGAGGLVLLGVSTPLALVMLAGALLGLGLGITSTTFIVVVQTAVGWEQRGVATALQQFCRAIGGTLWVSVQGAALGAAVAGAHGDLAGGGHLPSVNDVLDPGLRALLPPEELRALAGVLQDGLHQVFVLYLLLALAGLAIVAFLPGRPLKSPRGYPAARPDVPGGPGEGTGALVGGE
ncbi:MAG TPA: MFS transporter [Chloroflexota bacterium]|nr:MFS transporter [Chloroflexota bacterium]